MILETAPRASRQALGTVFAAMRRHLQAGARDDAAERSLLAGIEDAVRLYETDYRGFLSGDLRWPPRELAAALTAAFRELATDGALRPAVKFRLGAAEARFHAAERHFAREQERRERSCA